MGRTATPRTAPPGTLQRVGLALLVTGVLLGLGWWPAQALGGDAGVKAMLLGAAVALLGALGGHLVGGLVRRTDPSPEGAPKATQIGIVVRLMLSLFLALPVVLLDWAPPMAFAAWLGLHYLGQLVLEVFVSVRELGQNAGPTEAAARSSQPEGSPPSTAVPHDEDPSASAPGAKQG